MSRSLIKYDAREPKYVRLRATFVDRYKAQPPEDPGEWQPEPGCLRLMTGAGRPVQVMTGVGEWLGYFGEDSNGSPDGKLRLSVTVDVDKQDEFFRWATATFAPDGSLHGAITDHFSMVVGKNKPAGVTAKNVADKVRADLGCGPGVRPVWAPQVLKVRETEDGTKTVTLSFNVYMCEDAAAPREAGKLPDAVAEAFVGMEDHPLVSYLRANPDKTVSPKLAMTVADGAATPTEIIAAASHKGKRGYYMKLLGRATLGGIHCRYLEARKLLMARMYLNAEGLRVYGVPSNRTDRWSPQTRTTLRCTTKFPGKSVRPTTTTRTAIIFRMPRWRAQQTSGTAPPARTTLRNVVL